MRAERTSPPEVRDKTVLLVGVGGLGCPAAWALASSGVRLVLCDDDMVDESNLHRQLLFREADVGRSKLEAARDRLIERGARPERVELVQSRLLPDNARQLVAQADVVLEGSDNYATKFLAADACYLERTAVVHGAALGWRATAWAVSAHGEPCYRCLFEDLPQGDAPNCNSAGVIGPVVGFAGAMLAELCLRVLTTPADSDQSNTGTTFGVLFSYDGKRDRLRETPVRARADCPLCGTSTSGQAAMPQILNLEEQRYTQPICAA